MFGTSNSNKVRMKVATDKDVVYSIDNASKSIAHRIVITKAEK